jgi:lysozyme
MAGGDYRRGNIFHFTIFLMTRPSITRALAITLAGGIADTVFLLGIRGFGAADQNKRGIYDDAIFLVTPEECIGFNANTDPSITRKGIAVLQPGTYRYKQGLHGIRHFDDITRSLGKEKRDEVEKWLLDNVGKDHVPLTHKNGDRIVLPYWAFRQAGPVTITRDGITGTETKTDPGLWPWIDIHKGGYNTTSSEGCQTIHPDQWPEARAKGFAAMNAAGLKTVNYVLINKPGDRG